MIYSCTMFFNEFDLLDLKLSEELDVIDKFIVSESNRTFSNNPKSIYLNKYTNPKIEKIFIIDKFVKHTWTNEKLQRNITLPEKYDADDVFIVSDVDEINKKEDINLIVESAKTNGFVRIQQRMYYYKINLTVSVNSYWEKSFAVSGKYLKECGKTFDELRRLNTGVRVKTNGRHFSYLGSPEDVAKKIMSFSHSELNKEQFTNIDKIKKRIENKGDPFDRPKYLTKVDVDDTYPSTILKNMDFWKNYMDF